MFSGRFSSWTACIILVLRYLKREEWEEEGAKETSGQK